MPVSDIRTVHVLPKGIRPVHKKYGLWICKFSRKGMGEPLRPEELPFRYFEFYDLSHLFDGKGWYCSSNGIIRKVEKGDGILVTPGTRHKYAGDKEPFIEDTISFCGSLADHLYNTGIIRNGIIKIGSVRRLLSIIDLVQDNSDISQIKANLALQNLLVELFLENKKNITMPGGSPLEDLLCEIKKHPDKIWDVEMMADFCNLSLSQFKRVFIKRTGLPPQKLC
jgi:AraC-like DNA-binding protein